MAVGDAERRVRAIRTGAGWVLPIALAACIPFWTIEGTKATGSTVLPILYGVLIASALIWMGAALWLRGRGQSESPPEGRVGIRNVGGGTSHSKRARFGRRLGAGIENVGEGSHSLDEDSTFDVDDQRGD